MFFVVVFTLLRPEEVDALEVEMKGERDTVEGKPEGETFVPREDDVD